MRPIRVSLLRSRFVRGTICAHDSGRRHLFVASMCVCVCVRARERTLGARRATTGANTVHTRGCGRPVVVSGVWCEPRRATPALLHHCFGNSKHAHAAGRVAAASCNAVSIYPTVGPARFNRALNDLEKKGWLSLRFRGSGDAAFFHLSVSVFIFFLSLFFFFLCQRPQRSLLSLLYGFNYVTWPRLCDLNCIINI